MDIQQWFFDTLAVTSLGLLLLPMQIVWIQTLRKEQKVLVKLRQDNISLIRTARGSRRR